MWCRVIDNNLKNYYFFLSTFLYLNNPVNFLRIRYVNISAACFSLGKIVHVQLAYRYQMWSVTIFDTLYVYVKVTWPAAVQAQISRPHVTYESWITAVVHRPLEHPVWRADALQCEALMLRLKLYLNILLCDQFNYVCVCVITQTLEVREIHIYKMLERLKGRDNLGILRVDWSKIKINRVWVCEPYSYGLGEEPVGS
jgi:hypothetical protein